MKTLAFIVLGILLSALLLYVATFFPVLGFSVVSEYQGIWLVYLFLGVVFWFFEVVVKTLIKIFALPLNFITFGVFSLVLNIVLLYVFEQFVNYLDVGVTVALGTLVQVAILALGVSVLFLLLKHK